MFAEWPFCFAAHTTAVTPTTSTTKPPRPAQLRERNLGQTKHGGRYAGRKRAPSSVALNPVPTAKPDTPLTDREASAVAYAQALMAAGRYLSREDIEDVAQDAILSVLKSVRTGTVTAMTPGLLTKSVRYAVAANLGVKNGIRHTDHLTRGILDLKIDAAIQDLGRMLHDPEIDNMAAVVRDAGKDPRRKAVIGYQIRKQETR